MDPQPPHFDSEGSGLDEEFSEEEFSSSDSDEELFYDSDEEFAVAYASAVAASNITLLFNANELEGQFTVNPAVGTLDFLARIRASSWMFKNLTNFTEAEFDELCSLVVPTITTFARSTGLPHGGGGRPSKLTPHQRLLNCLIFLKHDNTVRYEAFKWNWNPAAVCDDVLFICSCLNVSIADEIKWPSPEERRELSRQIPQFPGCIGMVDGTLIKIRRPFNNVEHSRWFNGRKKMYAINNTVMIDHSGLFIHLDVGCPGSFHDINILRHSDVYNNWRQHFQHEDDNFQYLLGDPGYIGSDHFIMRRIGNLELQPDSAAAISAFNRMHAGYRVRVEWGIGGLKRKWRRLMKQFDCSKVKFGELFYAAALMTNFLHRRRMDFSYETVGDREADEADYGWDGDF